MRGKEGNMKGKKGIEGICRDMRGKKEKFRGYEGKNQMH